MLTVFFRVVLLYAFSVIAMRLMGKRQVGQLQPYELVLALMVAEIAAAPMEDVSTPLLQGLVPILVKSMKVRRMLFGVPGVVIREGSMDARQMKRMGYTVTDLMEELRGLGYQDVSQIHTAILETNGRLSAFPKAAFAPVTTGDMQMNLPQPEPPYLLIVDGRVQKKHLQESGHDAFWLMGQLKKAQISSEKHVLLASLNSEGELYLQVNQPCAAIILKTEGEA